MVIRLCSEVGVKNNLLDRSRIMVIRQRIFIKTQGGEPDFAVPPPCEELYTRFQVVPELLVRLSRYPVGKSSPSFL